MKNSLLIILDGFGHRDSKENNAIAAASTPHWDKFWKKYPKALLSGSGADVGLPEGQMGNSEVGHMTIGAGRMVDQDLTRINQAIETGEFARNQVLQRMFEKVLSQNSTLHILGLVSPGGVHSHEDHIVALISLAADLGLSKVCLHAFLDGRDTAPRSALPSLEKIDQLLKSTGIGCIASVTGRYYAMDRDNRWDRIERAYNMLVRGEAPYHATSASEAIDTAYKRGEGDEFVQPTCIHDPQSLPTRIGDNDTILFMNFRADRARQITRAIVEPEFEEFDRKTTVDLLEFVMLTRYADDIKASCAFEPLILNNTLGEYLSKQGKSQLRLAETEKYAHVTFFFSGGREEIFEGETRTLIPSVKVSTYDQKPEMSAEKITDELISAINTEEYNLIVCNFANGDMVGHTGNFAAAIKAVETLDQCLGRIERALVAHNGQMLITSDHGNVEQMVDIISDQAHTAHTTQPVPLVYIGPKALDLRAGGTLVDVAPTLLDLMEMDMPTEMKGSSLAILKAEKSNQSH